ncbi:hypothetical protein OSB04_009172 [Centaurea solstitialis]|uniref:Uncharacterized protein n=1 Tax=Centaurea solstitialis TaxID=347529 RepID=A0AA38U6H2_9ASTR|nr:hypothetical protein OSB04_009172 [Centaurea solstitialis]
MTTTLHPKLRRFSIAAAADSPENLTTVTFDDILTQIISTVSNFIQYLISQFNNKPPPESHRNWFDAAAPYLLAAASFATCLFVFHCFFSCISFAILRFFNAICSCFPCFDHREERSEVRMMIAPGRSPWMLPRDAFEADPRGYFRDLRRKPNDFAYSRSNSNWR